jgi:hypothetical protein
VSDYIVHICLHTHTHLFLFCQKNGNKCFTGRSLSPSVTNDQVTLKAFRQAFYFKVPNLTSEIWFFGTVLQYPFRSPHTSSKGDNAAGFHCCKEMFKYVPLETGNQRRLLHG